jgi:hypothetical protein
LAESAVKGTARKEAPMNARTIGVGMLATAVLWFLAVPATAQPPLATYEVTLTNLTSGQPLTPPVVATHRGAYSAFDVGKPASEGVRQIAENGNSAALLDELEGTKHVSASLQTTTGPLVPGGLPGSAMFEDSVTFEITAAPGANRISMVSMLICTNDGFTGLDRVKLPNRVGHSLTIGTNAYDAGTEINTEDFADIVPPCQDLIGVSTGEPGATMSNPALAEDGVIHHHPGIQGIADLVPSVHGWTDPVARITVTRIK